MQGIDGWEAALKKKEGKSNNVLLKRKKLYEFSEKAG